MATDPRLAAQRAQQAAQDAAAAAQAAADAAAAEAAAQRAAPDPTTVATAKTGSTGLPTLDQSGRQVLQDTGVDLGTVVAEDVATVNEIGQDNSPIAGTGRESLLEMPGLSSAFGTMGGGLSSGLPELGATFQSGGGSLGKGMIMDGPGTPGAGADAGTGGDAGPGSKDPIVSIQGGVVYRMNVDGEIYEDKSGSTANGDMTTSAEFHKTANEKVEGGGVKGGDVGIIDTVLGWFGWGDDDADSDGGATDGGTDGGTTGSDGGTTPSASEPVPDEGGSFDPPPGWEGRHDGLPEDLRIRGAVAGAKGQDPEGEEDDGLAAGPGDEVINPGSEGTVYDTTRRGTVEVMRAVDWVGQPPPVDDKKPLPAELGVIDPGPGPEVINPGSGDQANADAEASTAKAYSTAPSTTGNGAATNDASTASDGMPAPADDGAPIDGGMVDEGVALLPPVDEAQDDSERGRDFGQSQGKGHGHGRGNDSDNDELD